MSFLWIICTSADGAIERLEVLKSKHRSKVGKYIRNNIDQFLFMFYKVWTLFIENCRRRTSSAEEELSSCFAIF